MKRTVFASKTRLKSYRETSEEYNTGLSQQNQISLWTVERHLVQAGILVFRQQERQLWSQDTQLIDSFGQENTEILVWDSGERSVLR